MSFTVRNLSKNQADCFLITLENRDKEKITILVDGNRARDGCEEVKELLDKENKKLDFIAVSHVDDDHLGGIIELLKKRGAGIRHGRA